MSQKQRYISQNRIISKKILITAIVFLAIILSIFLIALNLAHKKQEKQQAVMSGQFSSIQDILEYYGCKTIRIKENATEGFVVDIYTEFKYDLYEGEKSNEKFYNDVINQIATFLNYQSFRMIDTSKEDEIEIQVIGNGSAIETIYINGIEDYFIYMDSQMSLSQYKTLKTTEVSVQAPELINCMQNNWNTNTEFGTREAIFQNYYIYFDEGIQTRKINGKIYNIIFTKKYPQPVINGFTVGEKNDIIMSRLGEPTFQNKDKSIIGYKSNDLYVFFGNDQISIYPNQKEEGSDEFFALADKFLAEEYSLLEFMNELTYLWPDYEEYTYSEDTVFLSYPSRGIDVKINYDNMDGMILYNNISANQDVINRYLKHTEFVAQLQVDNIFNAEQRRVKKEKDFSTKCKEYEEKFEKQDKRNRGKIYDYYMNMDSNDNIMNVYFIAQNEAFTNCELNESMNSYVWMNDYCFVYSKQGKGIYFYDLQNQKKGSLLTGKEPYKIVSYENGKLTYDEDKVLEIQY